MQDHEASHGPWRWAYSLEIWRWQWWIPSTFGSLLFHHANQKTMNKNKIIPIRIKTTTKKQSWYNVHKFQKENGSHRPWRWACSFEVGSKWHWWFPWKFISPSLLWAPFCSALQTKRPWIGAKLPPQHHKHKQDHTIEQLYSVHENAKRNISHISWRWCCSHEVQRGRWQWVPKTSFAF